MCLILFGCGGTPSLPEAPGLDGLRAHLAAARGNAARAFDGWEMSEDTWRGLVTEAYVGHHADYAAELARRRELILSEVRNWGDAPIGWQYADDPSLTAGQVHARWMLPTGRPGAVAPGIDAVFFFDGARWRALVDLDALVASRSGCADAYLAMQPKECQEWAWSIAEAVLRDNAAGATRACAQSRALGCGR